MTLIDAILAYVREQIPEIIEARYEVVLVDAVDRLSFRIKVQNAIRESVEINGGYIADDKWIASYNSPIVSLADPNSLDLITAYVRERIADWRK